MVRVSKIVMEREGDKLGVNTTHQHPRTSPCITALAMHNKCIFPQTQWKGGLLGVTFEGMSQQVTYLIDEGMVITKAANAVISYLDHFFANYGIGEMHVHLHCDNCSGQNKNNYRGYMLWYLAWRVIHSLHLSVSVNFLITGHTKFGPDWCFGLIKQTYR